MPTIVHTMQSTRLLLIPFWSISLWPLNCSGWIWSTHTPIQQEVETENSYNNLNCHHHCCECLYSQKQQLLAKCSHLVFLLRVIIVLLLNNWTADLCNLHNPAYVSWFIAVPPAFVNTFFIQPCLYMWADLYTLSTWRSAVRNKTNEVNRCTAR